MASADEEALRKTKAAKTLKVAKPVIRPDVGARPRPKVEYKVRTQPASEPLRPAGVAPKLRRADPVVAAAPSNAATGPRKKSPERPPPPAKQTIPPGWEPPRKVSIPKRQPASQAHYRHLRNEPPLPAPAPDKLTLAISPNASLVWRGGPSVTTSLLRQSADLGRLVSMANDEGAGVRDVVLGLDFGTSSTKVVVGDRTVSQAYAVPFRDAVGIDAFLLPSRLYEAVGGYSLHGGTVALTDLKLSLMASPDDPVCQQRVVAYLALAIREVRGWLFTAHVETYSKRLIRWSLALGQPSDHATTGALTQLFDRLAKVAWALAGSEGEITKGLCSKSLRKAVHGGARDAEQDLEVIVMPEIAAQIFGFVSSDRFDVNARNIFLIVDVGAGTVDSCLFRAVPERGGSWLSEVYTSAVEPNGVMNLHRHRVAWWQRELAGSPQGDGLCREFETIKLATEQQSHIPDSFRDYLKGVTTVFSGKAVGPDTDFFGDQFITQVRGRTLWRTFKNKLLFEQDLSDVPFFLCGGGSRLRFYRDCREALRPAPGFTWLSAQMRELAIPKNLRAEGLSLRDFDRLSVAYGLSMLNRANVAAATPMPRLRPLQSDQWRSHYVDKDQM